jgi:hypothetical protein
LASKSSLLFVNADEFVEPPRPILSNVIHISGVGMEPANLDDLKVSFVFNWSTNFLDVYWFVFSQLGKNWKKKSAKILYKKVS